MVTRVLIAGMAIAALAPTAVAAAHPKGPPPVSDAQSFYFDLNQTHHPKKGSVQMSSPGSLADNVWYVVTAQGTASFSKPSQWVHPKRRHGRPAVVCGTPEAAPMFPSPYAATGKVGFDPESMFARIAGARKCGKDTLPRTTRRFQLSGRSRYHHPTPLIGRQSTPTATHAYDYPELGRGGPLQLREIDLPTYDNYGRFKITTRRATDADCAGTQYRAFTDDHDRRAFATEAACEAAL
ncbi:MAG TPA: hypothetical protein VFG42_16925 [Baekduia sp.]|uniref:hypothetical protein n=1 Tax=Baekduia sp. TaxID=2600305 RepID=UPI002D777ABF|nr:hypothetical protein [Baekduia sp.]HET6508481.1 hypothetical protein [Baekduia sp.]